MDLREARERHLSRTIIDAYKDWVAAGKPRKGNHDDSEKSGAASLQR